MSRYGILVNVDNCIGCQACFIACKQENKVAPDIQWNQIHRDENEKANVINYYRMSCQHCDNPACMKVCPMKAIYKGPNGEVLVDQSKCVGCKACLAACRTALLSSTPAAERLTTIKTNSSLFLWKTTKRELRAKQKDAHSARTEHLRVSFRNASKPALFMP